MEDNDNKLSILTQKIYEEGIEKAKTEAQEIIQKAKTEAAQTIAAAKEDAKKMMDKAEQESATLRQKVEAELRMTTQQAITTLKQRITELISDSVAKDIAGAAFKDETFVHQLMTLIVEKWKPEKGTPQLTLILNEKERSSFEQYLNTKHKELLNNGLNIETDPTVKEGFIVQPVDGNYRIAFSEKSFEAYFKNYVKNYTKQLLFEWEDL